MNMKSETTKIPTQQSGKKRLLRAMLCLGHPKFKPWMCWVFFIPQLILYLYWLGPVFVYYFEGVPPEASLETITGVWREEGKMDANEDGLTAPRYFVDTKSGPREVHCGFPVQQRFCGIWGGGEVLRPGDKVRVHYDSYFGILGFEKLNPGDTAGMTYQDAVYIYARKEETTRRNHRAGLRLAMLFGFYLVAIFSCWLAGGRPPVSDRRN
jgi:hypothetical protein